ncbi:MAG: PEGA domain-containing protein [Planctomycetes bacterium]|jgi:hypothetical protein|nr:PEGA domain-containing protein [Planctomycetota bacterium]
MRVIPITACVPVLALAGCATILGPRTFMIPVDSDPPGATVLHQGNALGVTPCTVPLRRNGRAGQELELRLDGHHPRLVMVQMAGTPWIAANALFPGLLGIVIDLAFGGGYGLDEAPLDVLMVAAHEAAPEPWTPALQSERDPARQPNRD